MKKSYNDHSRYDTYLKQLDEDIMSNRKGKNETRSKLFQNLNKIEQPSNKLGKLKYVSSFAVFFALLFFGYQFFANDITTINDQASTEPENNQSEELVVSEDADGQEVVEKEEKAEEEKVSETENNNDGIPVVNDPPEEVVAILPTYVPGQEHAEPETIYSTSYGDDDIVSAMYFHSESRSLFLDVAYMDTDVEHSLWYFEKMVYKESPIEKLEISGHPSILHLENEETAHYTTLHIFTETYIITLTTHGVEEEEIVKIAESDGFDGVMNHRDWLPSLWFLFLHL